MSLTLTGVIEITVEEGGVAAIDGCGKVEVAAIDVEEIATVDEVGVAERTLDGVGVAERTLDGVGVAERTLDGVGVAEGTVDRVAVDGMAVNGVGKGAVDGVGVAGGPVDGVGVTIDIEVEGEVAIIDESLWMEPAREIISHLELPTLAKGNKIRPIVHYMVW